MKPPTSETLVLVRALEREPAPGSMCFNSQKEKQPRTVCVDLGSLALIDLQYYVQAGT